MKSKIGSNGHYGSDVVVRCFNPVCGAWSEPGLHFCDSCLTGMCDGKLSVFKMGFVRREDVPWARNHA